MTHRKWDAPRLFPLREGTLAVSHGDTFSPMAAAASGCSTGSNPGSKTGPDCTNGYSASGWYPVGGECQQGFGVISKWKCNSGWIDLLP